MEEEYDCFICKDTGEITIMESVYPGEPHMAPIGTQPCICQIDDDDSIDDDDMMLVD